MSRERRGGSREGEIERKEPPIPNYSKLFCWMTDFISDQKQERKTEGGLRVELRTVGGGERGCGWEQGGDQGDSQQLPPAF